MKIQCQTLFDITATGVTGHIKPSRWPFTDLAGKKITDTTSWTHSRNQQRNWETLTQLISLRTQVTDLTQPVQYQDSWSFEFTVDNGDLFLQSQDSLGLLKADCRNVPMLVNLNEKDTVATVLVPDQNIWFSLMSINS